MTPALPGHPMGDSLHSSRQYDNDTGGLFVVPQRGGQERQLESWNVSQMQTPLIGPYSGLDSGFQVACHIPN